MTATELDPRLCNRPMMCNTHCAMDKDHRGRCSSVAFVCDVCGKRRRGQPKLYNTGVDDQIGVCFMCDVVERRNYPGSY